MVTKEWRCSIHGFFEATVPQCPHDCDGDIMQVFLTPVAVKSDKTKNADKNLGQLATDFKMTDIKSVREGEAQPRRFPDQQIAQPSQNPYGVQWGSPGSIGNYNLNPMRGEQTNGLAAVRNNGVQLTTPKPASYIADHQNLKISN